MYLDHTIARLERRIAELQREMPRLRRALKNARRKQDIYAEHLRFWHKPPPPGYVKWALRKPRKRSLLGGLRYKGYTGKF